MKINWHPHPRRTLPTVVWASVISACIVTAAAMLGRAARNFQAALTEKPDLAVYLLLPDEEIGKTTLLRQSEGERDYLAETKDGPKLVKLKKGEQEWFVALVEPLHQIETGGQGTGTPASLE